MDKVVVELIMGAIMLSLLFWVVPMYRESHETILNMAAETDYSEKIKEVLVAFPEDDEIVQGYEIIGLIRYCACSDQTRPIRVVNGTEAYTYLNENYDAERFCISADMRFRTDLGTKREVIFYSLNDQ